MNKTECNNCGYVFNENDDLIKNPKCPTCGSISKKYFEELGATITVGTGISFKHKRDKKSLLEGKTGDSYSPPNNKFFKRILKIDHENNLYYEKVWNDKTGEIIKECFEPLSDHKNHGSAKNKK